MNPEDFVVVITSLPEEGKTGTEFRVAIVNSEEFYSNINNSSFYFNMNIPHYTKKVAKAMTVAAAICKKNSINTIKIHNINEVFPRVKSEEVESTESK